MHASLESAHESANGETLQAGSLAQLDALAANVISDCTADVWLKMEQMQRNGGGQVDIVLDNAGYELFTDLCLASEIISIYGLPRICSRTLISVLPGDSTLHQCPLGKAALLPSLLMLTCAQW